MDTLSAHIVDLCERLAVIQNRTPGAIARRVGGWGGTYDRMKAGGTVSTRTAMRMLEGIRTQWPDGLPMPSMPSERQDTAA